MKTMKVVFRTDASIDIGTGHVMRCLTVAKHLQDQGAEVNFICRAHSGDLCDYIEQNGFEVKRLSFTDNNQVVSLSEIEKLRVSHAQWLGVSWQQDAEDTLQAIGPKRADWLVVDHYALDARWHTHLRDKAKRILVIDDLADRQLDCDLLLDQNFYLEPMSRYEHVISNYCQYLLGPKYALLRDEFIQSINNTKEIRTRSNIKRIIVFMGGADSSNETRKALLALDQLRGSNIVADIVVGAVNPHADEIRELCDHRDFAVFHQNVRNMAELMNQADLAIGAGGATTLERCFMKLPTLVIVLAENQRESISDLDKAGVIYCLGWYEDVQSQDISDRLIELRHHPGKLSLMSEKAVDVMKLDEYQGVSGLVEHMLN